MKSNTGKLIDELGEVRRQIADLVEKEERLKATIGEFGTGVHNGTVFCATVSHIDRRTLDKDRVARRLTAAALRACYKRSTYTEIRVTARSAATGRRSARGASANNRTANGRAK